MASKSHASVLSITLIVHLLATTANVAASIASACRNTRYPDACLSAFASVTVSKSPGELFDLSVQFAMGHAHSTRTLAYNLTFPRHDPAVYPPTGSYDCVELLDATVELLTGVLDGKRSRKASREDIETWLSAALTNQMTCSESLSSRPPTNKYRILAQMENLTQFISNSLALHRSLPGKQRGLVGSRSGFPEWLREEDQRLLRASPAEIIADAVVAKDGTGTHASIDEALAFVSMQASGGGGRTVIYIKAGTYNEYIRVPTKQKNVMLMGDGKGKTVIVGSHNKNDGWTTYQSATVAGMGAGFIAKDLTIVNNAGPNKQQAVALRVGADRGVVYHCSIEGYQDTLYAHSNRQFYWQNDIYGTVDFIFGNAAAVFQSCNISPRRPSGGQRNSITAQGRHDPNQNTGFVLQSCRITPAGNLGGVQTYLGRPWHLFSRTIIMQSYIDGCVNPSGWEPWSGTFALSTLYYGEYANTGPGASTSRRVRWPGVHSSLTAAQASQFTVSRFISGNSWIPGTGASFNGGL